MHLRVVDGDLLDQDVDAIVNAWNRNVLPWWLLVPQGVSRAIRKRCGSAPFREVARHGPIPLGGAVLTGAGHSVFRGIVHVAGIDLLWRASERSVRGAVQSAMAIAREQAFRSIAFPLIGAGTGGFGADGSLEIMLAELQAIDFDGEVRLVRLPRRR